MDFYIKIEARAAKEFSIAATGRDREICGNVQDHLILNTYREVLDNASRPITPLSLRIDNDIPIGKGCGSSAAARLAGIALAVHFGRLRWTDAQIIGEASRREHHADNASACWMGGLTVARMSASAETHGATGSVERAPDAEVVCLRPKGKWPLLLAVPDQSLATEEARLVLPAQYSRADAVTNVQNSMFLLAAFTQGRPDLLSVALEDRIHQPYRAALCPLLPSLQELKGKEGILGRSPERRRALRSDIPRSARAATEIVQTCRGPSLAKSVDRGTASHFDHFARRTRNSWQVLAERYTENTLALKCYSRRFRKSLILGFPLTKLISASCVRAEWRCRHPVRGLSGFAWQGWNEMKSKMRQLPMGENRLSNDEQVRIEIQTFLLALNSYPDRFSKDPKITFEKHCSSLASPAKNNLSGSN